MPNRVLTRDELPAACAEQARVWREQWRALTDHRRATCDHCWHRLSQTQMCCWCGKPWTLQLDMLPAVNDGDSGSGAPIPVSQYLPTGFCAWFSLQKSPCRGLLRWRKQPPNPRRSHVHSAGLTSRMPYGRGVDSVTNRVAMQIKSYLIKVYLGICNLCKEDTAVPSSAGTFLPLQHGPYLPEGDR